MSTITWRGRRSVGAASDRDPLVADRILPTLMPASHQRSSPLSSDQAALSLRLKEIQPPVGLFIPPGTLMYVESYNSVAGLSFRVNYRYINRAGVIKPGSVLVTPTSARAINVNTFDLSGMFLLSVNISAVSGSPKRGQCFVAIGTQTNGNIDGILFSDYIGNNSVVGFPGGQVNSPLSGPGFIRSLVGNDPAAGVEILDTVPANAQWRVIALRATLVTSAVVATRGPHLLFDDGANVFGRYSQSVAITASATWNIDWGVSSPEAGNNFQDIKSNIAPVILTPGWRIRTVTASLDAGDNWGPNVYLLEEWISP